MFISRSVWESVGDIDYYPKKLEGISMDKHSYIMLDYGPHVPEAYFLS